MTASPSTIGDRRFILFDKSLQIRDVNAAAASATGSQTAIALPVTKENYFEVVLDVAAHSGYSAGSAYWTITVEICDTSGGTYAVVGSYTADGTAKRIQLPLSGQYCQQIKSGAAYIRTTHTKTSTVGNLSYGAFINQADC